MKDHEIRYYLEAPEVKSVERCKDHGRAHAVYGWSKQLDPGWSEEQQAAYRKAYSDAQKVETS